MPQSKILLDSNAYFRLAYNLHPLLFVSFGDEEYTLYVIDDFQSEFDSSPRLQRKFNWVDEKEYKDNRGKKIKMARQLRSDIDLAFDFIWNHNIASKLGASRPDVRGVAFGHVLNIPIVTDDKAMLTLGEVFGVSMLRVIELLKLMYDCGHIKRTQIDSLVQHLEYDNDLPSPNFAAECKKIK